MRIGGFQKCTVIDYPGKVAAIVFTQGCNFRCGYCHNPALVLPQLYNQPYDERLILEFLRKRQGRLQGVVVTGGEPTIHNDLNIFLTKLKDLRYAVKLDTNGSRPDVLKNIIDQKLVDYIAMDIKAPLAKYEQIAGVPIHPTLIKKSITIIKASGIDHHFRTTLLKDVCAEEDIRNMFALTNGSRHVLQPFNVSNKMVKDFPSQNAP